MKKLLSTLITLSAFTSFVYADFVRIEIGGGTWIQSPDTNMKYDDPAYDGEDISKNGQEINEGYVWLLVKHPVPIVPNLRVEYTSISSKGIGKGEFDFFPFPINGADGSPSKLEMTQLDFIPYYNLLDNTTWITLDIGLDVKVVKTEYSISEFDTKLFTESTSDMVPMLYLRGRFEIPSTSIGLESDLKYTTDGDSTIYDFRAKVDYTLEFIPVIEPAIELGYRVQKIDVTTDEDLAAEFDFAGVYIGAMLRF